MLVLWRLDGDHTAATTWGSFAGLPEELIERVFALVDLRNLLNLACVNRGFSRGASSGAVWADRFRRHRPRLPEAGASDRLLPRWKDRFLSSGPPPLHTTRQPTC